MRWSAERSARRSRGRQRAARLCVDAATLPTRPGASRLPHACSGPPRERASVKLASARTVCRGPRCTSLAPPSGPASLAALGDGPGLAGEGPQRGRVRPCATRHVGSLLPPRGTWSNAKILTPNPDPECRVDQGRPLQVLQAAWKAHTMLYSMLHTYTPMQASGAQRCYWLKTKEAIGHLRDGLFSSNTALTHWDLTVNGGGGREGGSG